MGLFGSIGKMLTGIPRAAYNAVQLKPRAALGALGDTVKPVATVAAAVPGPWQPFAIPAAAAGGAMQTLDDEGNRGIGQFLTGGAKGAAMAAGARGASDLVRSGIGALTGAATEPATMAGVLESNMPSIATTGTTATNAGGGMWSDIGKFLTAHPEVVTQALGTAANVYGAGKQGAAIDRELEFRREQEEERRRQNELAMLLQAMSGMQQRGY